MKKKYMKPVMNVVELKHKCHILQGGSPVQNLHTNGDINGVGSDEGVADPIIRARSFDWDAWNEEEEERMPQGRVTDI